jgi:hypothetical protein
LSLSQAAQPLFLNCAVLFLLGVPGTAAIAQPASDAASEELAAISAASSNDIGPAGIVPAAHGFNASLGTTSQHDASSGWSWILTPNLAYRFNKYFSLDAGVPLYGYVIIYGNVATTAKPVYAYNSRNGVFGDTMLSFEGDVNFATIDYTGTISLGMPSGNTEYGLGAGQPTFNLNQHFERTFERFTPDIELGYGDTSILVNQRVLKDYVAVGPLAHFQAGGSLDLPFNCSFEANAYEELPLERDLVYSTTGKGKKKVTTSTNIDPAEDNGFITSLDIPLTPNVTMSGFYNRSLRDHDDVAGFSFTFLMKAPPRAEPTTH